MRLGRSVLGAIAIAGLIACGESAAIASPPPPVSRSAPAATPAAQRSRASIRLTVGTSSGWVGQAIPITVSAQFRDVEGVTLEGSPQITSDSVFTTHLAREPRQSTAIADGEPTLVATWAGTITPSTAGPIALSVELPVRIRFREAAAPPPAFQDPSQGDPFGGMQGDPFGGLDIDPSDPASIQRLLRSFQQSFSQPFETSLGRVHDEAITLKAASGRLEIKPLPAAGQPPTFSGAVGRFDMRASIAEGPVRSSDPVTLRVTVQGEGDLDRVDLPGIKTSSDWKAYPATSKTEAPAGKRLGRKTFEQVLIPLHGGSLMIPSITLSTFEPNAGRYTSIQTAPFTVAVEGSPAPSPSVPPAATASGIAPGAAADAPTLDVSQIPSPSSLVPAPRTVGLSLAPALAALLAAVAVRLWPLRSGEKALRRTLRRTAKEGRVAPFFEAAHRLIVVHFAKRWGVAETDVTAEALRDHLGPTADPLVDALSTGDALRFGRRDPGPIELPVFCSTIESSLRDAT
ncbi:MAG: BatD family protein [Polyangiaceae bacterium]